MTYTNPHCGKYCIIRARDAGVHAGLVQAVDGRTVHLVQSRRIWEWTGAFTLSELSQEGFESKNSRIGIEVDSIEILDACEIILCSDKAEKIIRDAPNG